MGELDLKEAILRVKELPTLPSVLGKILSTAADPNASALDLGEHIAADQSLSSTILKLVNTAYYGFYRQISSVTQAIVMLGFLEVRNLTLTATAFQNTGKESSGYDRGQLWRHSFGSAMAAERLNKMLAEEVEGAFEAGLLHDFGKVALDMLYPDVLRDAIEQAHNDEKLLEEVLQASYGTDHAELGGLLAEHWNLPQAVVEAIACHLAPEKAEVAPQLSHLTAVSMYAAFKADLVEPTNGRKLDLPKASIEALGLSLEQLAEVVQDLNENHEQIDEFLGVLQTA